MNSGVLNDPIDPNPFRIMFLGIWKTRFRVKPVQSLVATFKKGRDISSGQTHLNLYTGRTLHDGVFLLGYLLYLLDKTAWLMQ